MPPPHEAVNSLTSADGQRAGFSPTPQETPFVSVSEYHERQKVDMAQDSAWAALAKEHSELGGIDLMRFTFELDEAIEDIRNLVSLVFGAGRLEA